MASASQPLEIGPAARRAGTVTARKPRSDVDLEQGLGTLREQPLSVDGRPALVRLTASGLEWSAAARGGQAAQSIPFCEVLSAWQLEPDTAKWQQQRLHRLAVYSFARAARRRSEWHPRRLLLASPDQNVVRQLCEDIRTGIGLSPGSQRRPQRILLLLNPASGDQRAPALYRCIVGPVFVAAGVNVDVRETRHPGHARELVAGLTEAEVQGIDGIVAMGGDGAFHEVLNGVLAARASAPPALAAALGALRLGHIPAGSTDAVACSLNGSRSAFTAAVHVALGDDSPLDVLAVQAIRRGAEAAPPAFASCIAAAGFMGEVQVQAASLRWLGPLRYDLTGFSVLLQNRPFAAKVSWTAGPAERRLGPQHDDSVCHAGCGVCEAASFGAAAAAAGGGDSAARPPASAEDGEWHACEGEFLSIMVIISPCRSDKTQSGMARFAHLADGRAKLVLVRRCGRLAYLRFLLLMASSGVYPGCCPHVAVRDITAVRVELGSTATAAWNLDGELLAARAISAEVLPSRVRVFARGVER